MNKYRIINLNNSAVMETPTLYASGLITINDKGYTKHYFEEGKRICSKIGSGELQNVNNLVHPIQIDYPDQRDKQFDGINKTYEQCMNITPRIKNRNLHKTIINKYQNPVNPTEPSFYYHSDHLGSASFLTDETGAETQQLVYLPFGEDWVDMKYNTSQYDTPYKFNGKEKDEETGYNNFGARYYYDWATIWLSVDPMSDKYPHLTSYNYCANNPVMLVDPDGRKCVVAEEDQAYVNQLLDENSDNYSKGFADIYKRLDDSDHIYNFKSVKSDGFKDKDENNISGLFTPNNSPNESLIQFTKDDNPDLLDKSLGASTYRPLFEETFHAFQYERDGATESSAMKEAEAWKFSATAPGTKYHFKDKSGNYNMTVMGNIFFGSQNQVAFWLKFGKDFGNNVKLNALYNHLPYNSMRINSKTWKFENVY